MREEANVPHSYHRGFRSESNPTANSEQRELERLALDLLRSDLVQAAMAESRVRWKIMFGSDVPDEAWSRFDSLIEEAAFNYCLKSANSDVNYPKVLAHVLGPPHSWMGVDVPGSRAVIGDGPDIITSIIPIDWRSHYVIRGKVSVRPPADAPLSIVGNLTLSMTLSSLAWREVRREPDGSFEIHVGPEPRSSELNYLQSHPDARYIMARDAMADWLQIPNTLSVVRREAPSALPLSFDQLALRAKNYILDDIAQCYWFRRVFDSLPVNTMSSPFSTSRVGGLTGQMVSFGRLFLARDEAFVVELNPAGAAYHGLAILDYWFKSFNYWDDLTSYNNSQTEFRTDGSALYVVCGSDPGHPNWLNSGDQKHILIVQRWQGLPEGAGRDQPNIRTELVKTADLPSLLASGGRQVKPAEREATKSLRRGAFASRFAV